MAVADMIASHTFSSWTDIGSYARPAWIYRGQRSADWSLSTSLERCCNREQVAPSDRLRFERELLRDFRRLYHQYAHHVPGSTAIVEWMSLMQHHGAPTRLLDFTYSIYVAAYFALETADGDAAVWAVNGPWALRASVSLLVDRGKATATKLQASTTEEHEVVANDLLFDKPVSRLACPLSPFRQNERLRTQRGTFLVPGEVASSFMDNLLELPGHDQPQNLVKLVLPRALRAAALEHLYSMNISRTSLFPGLDGYAQSLGVFHPSFRPAPW